MNVNLEADTDKGTINDKVTQSIAIPLNKNLFTIEKNEVSGKAGAIEQNEKQQIPVNMSLIKLYGISEVILILALFFILFFSTGVCGKSPYEKALASIFNKHGNRLVALFDNFNYSNLLPLTMKTMEDLVRVADELERPIFYPSSDEYTELGEFFVFDDKWLYRFDLSDKFGVQETETQFTNFDNDFK